MGQEEANYGSIFQGSSHLLFEIAVKRPDARLKILSLHHLLFVCVLLAAVLAALKIPHGYSLSYSLIQRSRKSFH